MSELLSIWNNSTLTAGTLPPPFSIPNSPNTKSCQINNQSAYWLIVFKTHANIPINRIEPFSFITFPFEADISVEVDTSAGKVTTLTPELQFVDYITFSYSMGYGKGSTFIPGTGTTAITNGSTVNVGTMPSINVAGGSVTVPSATLANEQVPVAQVYTTSTTATYPSGSTSTMSVAVTFLQKGTVADVQKGTIIVKSAQGLNYTVASVYGRAQFADGTIFDNQWYFNANYALPDHWDFDGNSTLCNILHFTVQAQTAPVGNDSLTIYLLIDGTSTAIDTPPGFGVPMVGACDTLNDASGTITTANTSQQLIAATSLNNRRYILFQNISITDMWVNFNYPAIVGGGGGANSSILVPANGGSLVFEGNFVPSDKMLVACSVASSTFTCKWA